jgi:hypothetical protein
MSVSRFTPVARLAAQALALTLGAAVALGLVSCGKRDTKGLLPGDTASQIVANLDQVKTDAASGSCASAAEEVQTVQAQIDNLPSSVDSRLRANLEAGAQRLADEVNAPGACEATTTTTAPTTTTTEKTTTTKPKTTTTAPTTTSTSTSTSTSTTTPTTTTTPTGPPTTGGTPPAPGVTP